MDNFYKRKRNSISLHYKLIKISYCDQIRHYSKI